MKKICAMYFSGTGTTKKTVCHIAKSLSEKMDLPYEEFNFTPPASRKTIKSFNKDDIVIMGTPVIAGRVPNLLLKYLATVEGNGALGVPIVLFGNRNFDDALIELRNIMETDNFHTIAGGAFVGEHSFSETLGKGRPDSEDFLEIDKFISAIFEKITKGENLLTAVKVKGNDPVGPYYTPRDRNGKGIDIRKVKPKTNDNCTGCGLCASLCPLGSISFDDYKTITGICMKCCACVKLCPSHAKYFDDEGYLYHKSELEALYGDKRALNEWFI